MQQSQRRGRGGGNKERSGGGGGDRRGSVQQLAGGGRESRGQYHRKEKEDGKNAAIEETKAMMAKMRMEEKEAIEKHKKEQAAVEKRRREKAAIGNNKPEKDAAAGVYILAFCAFYYSVIFSALQLFTELFSIGYSKFFVYLHPTPFLNAKLVRFGLLLTKNHYFL